MRTFLKFIRFERSASALSTLKSQKIEAYLRSQAKVCKRTTLQQVVSCLRGFLRFQHAEGVISRRLHCEIDTSRVYRLEQLPKSLPWLKVQELLRSIDCKTPHGLRDFTMLFLIAAYGLRESEVVALTLDDIDWRAKVLRVPQSKTRQRLILPLTDEAGYNLHRYLKRGRPENQRRELFLRSRAPVGPLTPVAVYDILNGQIRRSGLGLKTQGTHVLRHSFAIRLLRQGVPMKNIGDTLGHRHVASTAVYLRLAVDELRVAAAPVPRKALSSAPLKSGWHKDFPRIRLRTGAPAKVPSHFRSGLRASIQRYLAIKKALGRRYVHETRVLLDWDAFLHRNQRCSKTVRAVTFNKWVNSLAHLLPCVRRARMRMVRNFLLFKGRDEPVGYIPDMVMFPKTSPPRPPRLVSENEMARVLATTDQLLPSENGSPLRAETVRIALLLLFCCGLRHGEVLRLRLAHFDAAENLLRVESTKFYKSRLVPLSPSVCGELLEYLELRRQRHLPMEEDSFLIWSHRRPEPYAVYSSSGLLRIWQQLCFTVGVLDQRGRPPRLHDLRHSFAVNTLQRWYAQGDDAQAKLPHLAAYLGHVSPVSTHYYLHLTPELREAASHRFHQCCAALFQKGGKI